MIIIPISTFTTAKLGKSTACTQVGVNNLHINLNTLTGACDYTLLDASGKGIEAGSVAVTPAQVQILLTSGAVAFVSAVAAANGLTPT